MFTPLTVFITVMVMLVSWSTVTFLLLRYLIAMPSPEAATIGLPGTNGFNGEHLVLIGAYQVSWIMAIAAGAGIFLTAAYFLWYFQRAFLGPANPRIAPKMLDLRFRELVIAVALGGMIFWIGLDAGPFVQRMRPSLEALEARIEQGSLVANVQAGEPLMWHEEADR